MKKAIALILLVAFTTVLLPVNAFGPTPGQQEGYSYGEQQSGSFDPPPYAYGEQQSGSNHNYLESVR